MQDQAYSLDGIVMSVHIPLTGRSPPGRREKMASIHNQTPTCTLTEDDYDTLMVHLGEQLTAELHRNGGSFPEGEAAKLAIDTLGNTFGTAPDQTISDWMKAAASRLGVNHQNVVGV
jgi:hypothetical protein